MAAGDVTVSIAIEGGVTKSVGLASDIRVKSKAYVVSIPPPSDLDLSVDANWQINLINDFADRIVSQANMKATQDVAPTPLTFTAAS